MKQAENKQCYVPPKVEVEHVGIERGFCISPTIWADDWQDGGNGNLSTD